MKFQKQLFRHNPPETYGDCARTVYACFLDLHPSEVPNFAEIVERDKVSWEQTTAGWLESKGLQELLIIFDGSTPLETVLSTMQQCNPGFYYMLSGQSKNGTNHVVICKNNKIVWDPAIDNSGIVGPRNNGVYNLYFLLPIWHTEDAE